MNNTFKQGATVPAEQEFAFKVAKVADFLYYNHKDNVSKHDMWVLDYSKNIRGLMETNMEVLEVLYWEPLDIIKAVPCSGHARYVRENISDYVSFVDILVLELRDYCTKALSEALSNCEEEMRTVILSQFLFEL